MEVIEMKKSYVRLLILMLSMTLVIAGCAKPARSEDITPSPALTEEETTTPDPTPASEPTPEPEWTVVNDLKVDHPTYSEGFLNENYGITVGYVGEIHYTTDGGQTWPRAENKSMCRFCLDIMDENTAWAGGNGGNVRVTRDGGKTWTAVSDINLGSVHTHICFVDDNTGWVCTASKFASTVDGGATWTEMAVPEGADSIAAINLRTADDGYLLTRGGLLFTTKDGGQTWSKQDLGFADLDIADGKNKTGYLFETSVSNAEIRFSDENNGYVVLLGIIPGEGYKVFYMKTSDGGTTWSTSDLKPVTGINNPSSLFITKDGKLMTLSTPNKHIVVLRHD
jgi:photosystem II stability/assembly factor-like uncharacterized protein